MPDLSPTKRRRTKGGFEMKLQGVPPNPIATNFSPLIDEVQVPWPKESLPVEIFALIISYLPRSSVQSMRCVNKDFEAKVSALLFKVVVVPFKPEIYGIAPEPTLAELTGAPTRANDILQGSVMLQDKGMRVFQGFGCHIRKFAMSFEFDEKKLENPPIKSDQEAIKAFWGIYRWPFKKYNRYAQLEGLEQTADETRTMAKALRFIGNANELGLSIDGGLGWLAGPDTNQSVIERGGKFTVFGKSRFVPEEAEKPKVNKKPPKGILGTLSGNLDGQHVPFQRMLQETDLNAPSLEAGAQLMADSTDTAAWPNQWQDDLFLPALASQVESEEEVTNFDAQDFIDTVKLAKAKADGCLLKPNDLTNAQREMLLEIEWAQRAFMQSYAIAIIDNPLTFENIEKLTIARIPNRHLSILRREDFWDGLPQLNKLSLAVIPDWRDVVKLPTSWVQDIKLIPSQSVTGVFQLLQEQISHRKNIKTFHFEWISGGEEGVGLFSRNQQILAAPLVFRAMDMINRLYNPQLLSLPNVEHLSLKNCWISPHILTKLGLTLKKQALQCLTLDSVSLTAYVPQNAQPIPVAGYLLNNAAHAAHQAAHNQNLLAFQHQQQQFAAMNGAHPVPAPAPAPALALAPAPANNVNNIPDWLNLPRMGSWASVIDTLSPCQTIAQVRHTRRLDLNASEPRDPGSLTKLDFKSCGYVRFPLDFDQSALEPLVSYTQPAAIAKRIADIEPHMMKPHDYTLGVIVNHISDVETQTLMNVWNLNVGWGLSRHVLFCESQQDGIKFAGQGRFGGVIWQQPSSCSSG